MRSSESSSSKRVWAIANSAPSGWRAQSSIQPRIPRSLSSSRASRRGSRSGPARSAIRIASTKPALAPAARSRIATKSSRWVAAAEAVAGEIRVAHRARDSLAKRQNPANRNLRLKLRRSGDERAGVSFDFADVLRRMVELRASDVHLSPGFPPAIRVRGRITPIEDHAALTAAGHPRGRLLDAQRLAAQALRERAAARPRLLDPRRRPLPRQRLLPARLDQRRLPPHPERDPERSRSSGCRRCWPSSPASRAASCSSPGRPARASRPRSPRWST